jgi:hypothetical protein
LLADGVVRADASGATDASGAFVVGGLAPGDHDVLFVPNVRTSGYYDPRSQGTRVSAPVAGLELTSPIRVYTVRVSCEGRPVADATVHYFLPDGSVSGPTEPDGRYAFFMASMDGRHRVEVKKPGFASRELALGPPDFDAQGLFEVELERTAPASELTLELEPGHGPLGAVWIEVALAGSDWSLQRRLTPGAATIALGEVPAGDMHVTVRPEVDAALEPERQGRWLASETEITCRPSTAEHSRLALRPGGRAVFHVTGLGDSGPGSWYLSGPDARGSFELATWDLVERALRSVSDPQRIAADGSFWLKRPLAPGDYVLEVTLRGGERRRHEFAITAGRASDVHVGLR